MGFADRLKEARLARKLTQEQLADKIGISKGAISNYENGVSSPNEQIMYDLFDALGVEPNFLFQDEYSVAKKEKNVLSFQHPDLIRVTGTKKVKLLGNIACGQPLLAVEEDEEIEVPDDIPYEYAVRCKGNSMTGARIMDGDLVFLDLDAEIGQGDIAAVRIDDEVTLKRVYPGENDLRLLSENPESPVQYYHGGELDQVEIIGKAMYFLSRVRHK